MEWRDTAGIGPQCPGLAAAKSTEVGGFRVGCGAALGHVDAAVAPIDGADRAAGEALCFSRVHASMPLRSRRGIRMNFDVLQYSRHKIHTENSPGIHMGIHDQRPLSLAQLHLQYYSNCQVELPIKKSATPLAALLRNILRAPKHVVDRSVEVTRSTRSGFEAGPPMHSLCEAICRPRAPTVEARRAAPLRPSACWGTRWRSLC